MMRWDSTHVKNYPICYRITFAVLISHLVQKQYRLINDFQSTGSRSRKATDDFVLGVELAGDWIACTICVINDIYVEEYYRKWVIRKELALTLEDTQWEKRRLRMIENCASFIVIDEEGYFYFVRHTETISLGLLLLNSWRRSRRRRVRRSHPPGTKGEELGVRQRSL